MTLISDALQRKVRLRISAHALKTVERRGGLDAFLMKAKDEELSERCQKLKREVQQGAERAGGGVGVRRRSGQREARDPTRFTDVNVEVRFGLTSTQPRSLHAA